MATDDKITVTIEADKAFEGHLRLSDFLATLKSLNRLVNKVDAQISEGKAQHELRVTRLSHNSPIVAELALSPSGSRKVSDARAVTARTLGVLKQVQSANVREYLGFDLVKTLVDLAKPVGKRIRRLVFESGKETVDIDESFADRVRDLARTEDECFGEFEGKLEQINIHGGANTFRIYPYAGPTSVVCKFRDKELSKAKEAIGLHVCVFGLMKFQPMANWPHEIIVDDIEIYPPESELPSFENLRGIAPEATSDLSSEEFVRRLRDEWA